MDSLEDIWADPENVRIEVPDNVFEQPDADGEYECEAGDFETDEVFGSFEELTEWAQRTAMDLGYVLVLRRTNKNSKEVVNKVTLICHHGGARDARLIGPPKRSSKIGCPFTLIGRPGRDGGWRLTVKDWRHNHDPTTNLQGNAYARRMTDEEKEFVGTQSDRGLYPHQILVNLKLEFPGNLTRKGDITNFLKARRRSGQAGRTPMQVQTLNILLYYVVGIDLFTLSWSLIAGYVFTVAREKVLLPVHHK